MVFGLDNADRSGLGAHDDRLGDDAGREATNPVEHGPVGDAGGREHHVAAGDIVQVVDPIEIGDPHTPRMLALLVAARASGSGAEPKTHSSRVEQPPSARLARAPTRRTRPAPARRPEVAAWPAERDRLQDRPRQSCKGTLGLTSGSPRTPDTRLTRCARPDQRYGRGRGPEPAPTSGR